MFEIEGIAFYRLESGEFTCVLGFEKESAASVAFDTLHTMDNPKLKLSDIDNTAIIEADNTTLSLKTKLPLTRCYGYFDFKREIKDEPVYISTITPRNPPANNINAGEPMFYRSEVEKYILCNSVEIISFEDSV